MKVSTAAAAYMLLNTVLLTSATQHIAFTLEGIAIVVLGVGINVMTYRVGRRDGKQ